MATQVDALDISDSIIAFVGPTGAGKSTFIDIASRSEQVTAGHTLEAKTSKVRAVRVIHPKTHLPVVLVDTPGFNDPKMTDKKVLTMVTEWLETTYKRKVQMSGIVYVHQISANRMTGSPLNDLATVSKLCGDSPSKNVMLVTTMWDRVKGDEGVKREAQLRENYWDGMLKLGSTDMRFYKTHESAWGVIDALEKNSVALLLQEEMNNLKMLLDKKEGGKALFDTLQKQVTEQQETIRRLREEATSGNNPQLVEELTRQYNELKEGLQVTFKQIGRLEITFSKRILHKLGFGKK